MKTYKEVFSELNHAAVIPFFVIGDPDYDTSLEIVKAAVDAGADILELGIPFSPSQRPSNLSGRSNITKMSPSAF